MKKSIVGAALFALSLVAACGEGNVVVVPAPAVASAAGRGGAAPAVPRSPAGAGGSAGAAGGTTGPIVRTVETRKPFGNLDAGNLLWDGDLEWHGPFVSQYSWVAASNTGPSFGGAEVSIIVGPVCRSGLKCAELTNAGLAAIGVAPTTAFTHARAWVRVPAGVACADVAVLVEGCFFEPTAAPPLEPVSPTPDAKGWCHFEGDRATPDDAVCLYFTKPNGIDGDFFVDDAFVGAGAATKTARTFAPPTADSLAHIRRMQGAIRDRLHRLPPAFVPPAIRTRR